ncbi:hypothetical protein [Desertibaculum subflavum]|uniref:hypothetical protein n=1 Tax=Desertibaculum subflavum TaxID=2268458 RepID=UPI000E66C58A
MMRGELDRRSRFAPVLPYLILIAAPLAIFGSALAKGRIILSDTDSLFAHYPNMLFGLRSLLQGSLGLWNPYIFAGTDFSQSMHHHMLNPMWWILVPFGEKHFLFGLTLFVFGCYLASGFLAFRIARLFIEAWPATIPAVIFQISGYAWFTTTVDIAVPMSVAALLSSYIVLTFANRSSFASFAWLSLSLLPITLAGHVVYIAAYLLVVAGALVVRLALAPNWQVRSREAVIFGVAAAFALTISLYRIVPVIEFLRHDGSALTGGLRLPVLPNDAGYLLLPGVVPAAFGYTLHDSLRINEALGVDLHIQFHASLYFGVVALFFLALALTGRAGQWARIVGFACLFLTAAQTPVVPAAADLAALLSYPVVHGIVIKAGAAFMFLLLMVLVCRACFAEAGPPMGLAGIGGLFAIVAICLVMLILLHTKVMSAGPWPDIAPAITLLSGKTAVVALLAGAVYFYLRWPLTVPGLARFTNGVIAVCVTLFAIAAIIVFATKLRSSHLVGYGFAYEACGVVWAVATLMICRRYAAQPQRLHIERHGRLLIGLLIVVLLVLLIDLPMGSIRRPRTAITFAPLLSALRIVVTAAALGEIVMLWSHHAESKRFFLVALCVLAFGDLQSFNRTYGFMAAEPFVRQSRAYPPPAAETPTWLGASVEERRRSAVNFIPDPPVSDTSTAGWQTIGEARIATAADERFEAPVVRLTAERDGAASAVREFDVNVPVKRVALGGWVRAVDGGAHLVLQGDGAPRKSDAHSGSGQWEWLSTWVDLRHRNLVRIGVERDGAGSVDATGFRLVSGRKVAPTMYPLDPAALSAGAKVTANDFANYRVDRPHFLTGHPFGEVIANISMLYGLRTYGGVDSDVRADLRKWLTAFAPPGAGWMPRFGILPKLDNERGLAILGVRYHFDENGRPFRITEALPRFALFQNYQAVSDFDGAIELLRRESFDFETTVALEIGQDVVAPRQPGMSRQKVDYREISFEHILLDFEAAAPSILLFNDGYSPHWRAEYNGRDLPIFRANGNFMAVLVPAGRGELIFRFRPEPFLTLAKLAVGLGAILGICVFLAALGAVRGQRAHRAAAAGVAPGGGR